MQKTMVLHLQGSILQIDWGIGVHEMAFEVVRQWIN
jgi:hypothetical protein